MEFVHPYMKTNKERKHTMPLMMRATKRVLGIMAAILTSLHMQKAEGVYTAALW